METSEGYYKFLADLSAGNREAVTVTANKYDLVYGDERKCGTLLSIFIAYKVNQCDIDMLRFVISLCAARRPLQEYVEEKTNCINTILFSGARTYTEVLRALLDYGVNPSSCALDNIPIINDAITFDNVESVKLLLHRGACTYHIPPTFSRTRTEKYVEKFIARKDQCRASAIAIAGIKSECFKFLHTERTDRTAIVTSIKVLPRDILISIAKMVWEARFNEL